jgi:microcystin-dependent protein
MKFNLKLEIVLYHIVFVDNLLYCFNFIKITNIMIDKLIIFTIFVIIFIFFAKYCYATSENFTNISNEALQNLGSVYNLGTISVNDLKSTGNLNVTGSVNFLPKGIIVAWSGTTVPTGWVLCDGTNSTPDLRDKFILGAGTVYSPNTTGGKRTHILTVDEIPSHNHYTIDDSFKNNMDGNYFGNGDRSLSGGGGWYVGAGGSRFTTSSVGAGKEHNNMPPFYTLAYIMRNV